MAATLLIAAALTAQPAISPDQVDVGYDELAKGQPTAAIARITANADNAAHDPAALINLGTAYARLGEKAKAADYYRAAIVSPERFDLQLPTAAGWIRAAWPAWRWRTWPRVNA
jgi:tetratricopeptide (TPR) repeat protein